MGPVRRGVRALAALLGAAAVLAGLGAAPAAASPAGPVVLVGYGGVRWDDVGAGTPALRSFLEDGAAGVVATRGVRSYACPVDGWLAVSAGRRAGTPPAGPTGPLCAPLAPPGPDGAVPGWQAYVDAADAADFDARPGALGDLLAGSGFATAAVGPGAAVALATSDGVVPTYVDPGGDVGAAVARAVEGGATLVVVDAGAVRDDRVVDDGRGGEVVVEDAPPRAQQVAAVDAAVGAVLEAVAPVEGATVLAAGLADSSTAPRLAHAGALGPAPGGGTYAGELLGSRSTRQPGVVQTTDLTPTLVALVGLEPPAGLLVGAPVTGIGGPAAPQERLEALLDLDRAAVAVRPLVPVFFTGFVGAQLLLYGLASFALRKRWGGAESRRGVLAAMRRTAVAFAAVPVSTYLANLLPWWRAEQHLLAIVGAVAVGVALVSAVALLGPWRTRPLGPVGAVAAVTAAVLAADALAGSPLQLSSLMGLQPLVAGRFYGFGNVAFALVATGSLLAAAALADPLVRAGRRGAAAGVVAAVGVAAVVVDGTPGIGSDFGGPPAMVPAFALLAMLVGGLRLGWRRALLVGAATVAVMAALSLLDWLRPAGERTHLGRFVDEVVAGQAGSVVRRKLQQNWDLLTEGNEFTVLLPFAAVFVALVLLRPSSWGVVALQRAYDRAPALRPGCVAIIVCLGIGFAVNDSGVAVPGVGALLAIPLLIAVSARALELDDAALPPQDAPAPGAGATRAPAPTPAPPR